MHDAGGNVTGVVLTELVEFVETRLGVGLPDASFSAAVRYDTATFLGVVDRAAAAAGLTRRVLLERFGVHLFGRFAALYPVFFVGGSAMDLLRQINTYVHGEVQKLYPDAEFPAFDVHAPAPGRLELSYRSSRPLADLADGLIRGCVAHFGEPIRVERHDPPDAGGHAARFVLTEAAPRTRRRG
jgi:heme-NO-binding protein